MNMIEDRASRILIVEDEAVVAVDLQSQLGLLGYEVVDAVATAAEANRQAAHHRPDLILMDICLSARDDGVEVARSIREKFDIPIVFLTAFGDAPTVQRASQVGAYGYLVKPYDEQELHSTIQMALERSRNDLAVQQVRDDLLTMLDVQRQGAIALDESGCVSFISRAAEHIFQVHRDTKTARNWNDLMGLGRQHRSEVERLLAQSPTERQPLTLHLAPQNARKRVIELEIHDDPRDSRRKFFFVYDVSQLYDLRQLLEDRSRLDDIVGKSDGMRHAFQLVEEVAPYDASVLIEGETGTGKELIARAIHNRGPRREGPLVALNCGGLGEELATSQLFGHQRGAFTGAGEDHKGLFEVAHGGTLFLDEVGELSPRVQTMLLRVLEEKAVRRLGESALRPVDVRLIAATNRSLASDIEQGSFRADLLYRLRVCRIVLPPLRDRRDDVPLLVRQFLAEHAATMGKSVDKVSDAAMCILLAHDWPGNVRELKNAIEFALIRAESARVESADLPPEVLDSAAAKGLLDDDTSDERGRILAALERTDGNRVEAAKLLGISRATLYRRMGNIGSSDAIES